MVEATLTMQNGNFEYMAMKESAKLPENIKAVAEELSNYYVMPIALFIKLLKIEYRKHRIKKKKS